MTTQTPVRPQRAPAPRLRVMADARPHLTPFRRRVIRLICSTAAAELGDRLNAATVWLWRSMEEEDSGTLVLALEANADQEEMDSVESRILASIALAAKDWSEPQRHDFSRMINFELAGVLS